MSATAPMNSALPIAPPMQSPMQMPVQGGGMQSPLQAPIQGGGAQSPMQVPMQPSAVQGAAGGGALAQPAPVAAPVAAAPVPAPAPAPAPAAQLAAPVTGGGAADMAQVVPVLQQLVTTLTSLVTALQAQLPAAQAQAGAAGVQGGGSAVAGDAGAGAAVTGGGAPGKGDPVQSPVQSGSGCGCGMGAAKAAGETVGQAPSEQKADKPKQEAPKPDGELPQAPPLPGAPAPAGDKRIDPNAQTVKGKKMTAEQAKLTETVLRVGQEMGANKKVLETAVATMIQESVIKNDSSVDGKDHDSLGLFQQRPSAGWGTREQISDPAYAARKFFEKAIPNDKKKPDQPKTLLAQSVQISAFPNAYAQWDKEAEKIVADYLG